MNYSIYDIIPIIKPLPFFTSPVCNPSTNENCPERPVYNPLGSSSLFWGIVIGLIISWVVIVVFAILLTKPWKKASKAKEEK